MVCGRLVLPGEELGERGAAAGLGRVEERVPLDLGGLGLGCGDVVDRRERRAHEEHARGLRVVQVPVLFEVGVDGLLDGAHLGLLGDVPQGSHQVALDLHRPYDPVAVHEQGRAAQTGVVVDAGRRGGVAGEDGRDVLLASRLDGEGEGVAHDAGAQPGGLLQARRGRAGLLAVAAAGLPQDGELERAHGTGARAERLHLFGVVLAVDPCEVLRGTFPLAGDEPLGGILEGLAQLVADVARNRRDVVAELFVRLEELLLGPLVEIHQQDDPEHGAVEG